MCVCVCVCVCARARARARAFLHVLFLSPAVVRTYCLYPMISEFFDRRTLYHGAAY